MNFYNQFFVFQLNKKCSRNGPPEGLGETLRRRSVDAPLRQKQQRGGRPQEMRRTGSIQVVAIRVRKSREVRAAAQAAGAEGARLKRLAVRAPRAVAVVIAEDPAGKRGGTRYRNAKQNHSSGIEHLVC